VKQGVVLGLVVEALVFKISRKKIQPRTWIKGLKRFNCCENGCIEERF